MKLRSTEGEMRHVALSEIFVIVKLETVGQDKWDADTQKRHKFHCWRHDITLCETFIFV